MTDLEKALAQAGIDGDQASALIKGHMELSVSDDDVLDAAGSLIAKAMNADKGMGHSDVNGMDKAEDEEEDEALLFDEIDDEDEAEKGYGSYKAEDMDDEDMEEDDEDMEKAYDMVAIISKGADRILDSVETQNNALAKGFFAIRDAHRDLEKSVASLEGKLDALVKAMGQPVAPRSALSAADVDVIEPMAKSVGISGADIIAKAKSKLAESNDMVEQRRLAMAVAEIDSGMNPETVAARYGIV